jgi:hypothetical protein
MQAFFRAFRAVRYFCTDKPDPRKIEALKKLYAAF